MIWLTWRQFRGSAAMMAAVLVVLAAALALTGPGLADQYAAGLADCTPNDTCGRFFDRFFDEYHTPFMAVSLVVLVLPALLGLFWGAPLLTRELEAGTHLMVWNQGITRRRWLAAKLGLIGLVVMAAAGLCGLAVTWWSDPLDKSAQAGFAVMDPLIFGARGIAPIAYAAFAFVLGVTLGMMVRRTLLAMALTLAVFTALQLGMPLLVRPHLMPPVVAAFELGPGNVEGFGVPRGGDGRPQIHLRSTVPDHAGAWVLGSALRDPSGRVIATEGQPATVQISTTSGPCAPQGTGGPGGGELCLTEINRHGYRQLATYHPLERFWPFQWIESGIYALLTLALTWFCFWWIRRRVS
ncbi:ABC transporter permease [Nonomuraea sp. NN258]|uniref:ABC transporter permease n=1 Tax=Nonomuraea antri TaxID=2730852 RepID=UPI001568E4E8|nr:ABC transporter permease [Nonomuraea antri]NRQ36716.1 ABC transporter permease [Nonomuraea antri]